HRVAITGPGGLGKTALALRWAHCARDRFPDGQLYLDLHGYSGIAPVPPLDAVGRLLRDLGMPAERVPHDLDEAAAAYRSLLSDKRMLVVLDNARHPDQVRPLLPGGSTAFTVVTGRDRFSGMLARDGFRRVPLDALAADEATALLTHVVGDRIAAEPEAAAELARACGFLPLALRITAARLADDPHRSVAEHLRELRRVDRFSALRIDGDEEASVW